MAGPGAVVRREVLGTATQEALSLDSVQTCHIFGMAIRNFLPKLL